MSAVLFEQLFTEIENICKLNNSRAFDRDVPLTSMESGNFQRSESRILLCPLYCDSCQQVVSETSSPFGFHSINSSVGSTLDDATKLMMRPKALWAYETLPITRSCSESNLLHDVPRTSKKNGIGSKNFSMESIIFYRRTAMDASQVVSHRFLSEWSCAPNFLYNCFVRLLCSLELVRPAIHQGPISYHFNHLIMVGLSEVAYALFSMFNTRATTNSTVEHSLMVYTLLDLFSLFVNRIISVRPAYSCRRTVNDVLEQLHCVSDQIVQHTNDCLWVLISAQLQRGALRIIYNDFSKFQLSRWRSNWSTIFSKLRTDSKLWPLYKVCVHELAVILSRHPVSVRSFDDNVASSCAGTIPPPLVSFLIDFMYVHYVTRLSSSLFLSNTSFCESELFEQICLIVTYFFDNEPKPHFLPVIAFFWNNIGSSHFTTYLSVFFSNLTDQIMEVDSVTVFLTRLLSFFEHVGNLLTNTRREIFLTYFFELFVLPLCVHVTPLLQSENRKFDCLGTFLKLWVYALYQIESFTSITANLAVTSLKCLDPRSVHQLAIVIRESPDVLSGFIKELSGLLLRDMNVLDAKRSIAVSGEVWASILEHVVQLSISYLLHYSVGRTSASSAKSQYFVLHNLCRLLIACQYVRPGQVGPIISFFKLLFLSRLHSPVAPLTHTIVSLATWICKFVVKRQCKRIKRVGKVQLQEWCNCLCTFMWPNVFLLLEIQIEDTNTELASQCTECILDLFTRRLWPTIRLQHSADSLLFDKILPSLSSMSPASLPESTVFYGSSGFLILLLRVLTRFVPEVPLVKFTENLGGITRHPSDIDSWARCATQLSSQLLLSVQSSTSNQLESALNLLLDEILSILPARISCTTLSDAILDMFRAGLVGRGTGSTFTRLSPDHLEKIIRIICGELKNPTKTTCVGCQKFRSDLVMLKLLRLLTAWTSLCDPLSPSSFISWPMFNFSEPLCSVPRSTGFDDLQCCYFATAVLPTSEPSELLTLSDLGTNELNDVSVATTAPQQNQNSPFQPGLLISLWFQPPYTINLQATPLISNLAFVNMAITGELIHVFTLESSTSERSFSHPSEALYPSVWALQVWFCIPYSMFYLRVSNRVGPRTSASSFYTVQEWESWLPFLSGKSIQIPIWHHVLFRICQINNFALKVQLRYDGLFEYSTELTSAQLKKVPADNLEMVSGSSLNQSNGTWFHFGHRADHPWYTYKVGIGGLFFFKENADTFHNLGFDLRQLGLCLTLLGPDWNGHFDSLESGARYTSMAWCFLHSLVRRYYSEDFEANLVATMFLEGSNLISTSKWFHCIRDFFQNSLFLVVAVTESPLRVMYRQSHSSAEYVSNSKIVGPSHAGNLSNGLNQVLRPSSKSVDWLSNLNHMFPMCLSNLGTVTVPVSSLKFPAFQANSQRSTTSATVHLQQKISVDHAFEPHGGLGVVLHLLGQVVANESGGIKATADLQAAVLQLLFSLLNVSVSMCAYFGAPALSNPGTESSVAKRRRPRSYSQLVEPLSVGDCLLARLIKHPKFASTSAKVTQVLLDQLFAFKQLRCRKTTHDIPETYSSALLVNPGLLRCLLAFGVRGFWCERYCYCRHCKANANENLTNPLIPRTLNLVYLALSNSSVCSAVTAYFLDRWQLLVVAFSAFRELFLMNEVKYFPPEDTLTVTLAPLLMVLVRRLTWFDPSYAAPTEHSWSWSEGTELRRLFDQLCRLIITLDTDLYIAAAERVFSPIADTYSCCSVVQSERDILNSTWTWWHKLSAYCIRPERWLVWGRTSDTEELELSAGETCLRTSAGVPPTTDSPSSFVQIEQQCVALSETPVCSVASLNEELQQVYPTQSQFRNEEFGTRHDERSVEHNIFQKPNESSFSSNGTKAVSPSSMHRIPKSLSEEQLDSKVQPPLVTSMADEYSSHCSANEIQGPPEPDSKNFYSAHHSTLGIPSPSVGTQSEGKRNQLLSSAIVCALDSVWSALLDSFTKPASQYSSDRKPTLVEHLTKHLESAVHALGDRSIAQRILHILHPPLWLVHSLLGHPCVHMREAGMNAYRIWLKRNRRTHPPQLNKLLIAQLLGLSPSFQLLDPKFKTAGYRHFCSSRFLDQAFSMVLDELTVFNNAGSSPVHTTRNLSYSNQTVVHYLCSLDTNQVAASSSSTVTESSTSQTDLTTAYIGSYSSSASTDLENAFAFLLAILLGSLIDAVMSTTTAASPSNRSKSSIEVELCTDGVTALTNLLQTGHSHLMPMALNAGLLPVLYNLGWILEIGIDKQSPSPSNNRENRLMMLTPLLTGLCRLLARIIQWILDTTISDVSVDDSFDSRFKLVKDFINHLLSMRSIDEKDSSESQEIIKPGPVSCCLVRRAFYSLLDILVQQINKSALEELKKEKTGSEAIKHIFEHLKWTVDNTVNTLTYSGVSGDKITTDHKSTCLNSPSRIGHPRSVGLPSAPNSDSVASIKAGGDHIYNLQLNATRDNLQQSLDQALLTVLFNAALNIQTGSLFHLSKTFLISISAADCFVVFSKALGRLLVIKTQPPISKAALDPTVNYLLKLFNEEPVLLRSCLNSLPRLFSLVFWTNLLDLESWLDTMTSCESNWISSSTAASVYLSDESRSSFESCRSENLSIEIVHRQLRQLSYIVQSLIAVQMHVSPFLQNLKQSSSGQSISADVIYRHRSLLALAQAKAQMEWSNFLLSTPEERTANVTRCAEIRSAELPSTLVSLLLPSFGAEMTPSTSSVGTRLHYPCPAFCTEKSCRRFSTFHLASQAHRWCIEGHTAWKDAFGERLRIAGPLSSLLWARLSDGLSHTCALFFESSSAPCVRCMDLLEGPMRQRRRMFDTHLSLADRLVYPDRQRVLAHRRQPHPLASLIGLPSRLSKPPGGTACNWSQLPLFLPLPATPLIQLASASRHNALGIWASRLVGLMHIPPVDGDLILGDSWLRFQPEFVTRRPEDESLFHVNPVARLWLAWPLSSIDHVEERRYSLRKVAVEIFPDGTSVNSPTLFALRSAKERNHFIYMVRAQLEHVREQLSSPMSLKELSGDNYGKDNRKRRLLAVQRRWLKGQMSNFAYLMELNNLAGRTYNDLMQYPIFPWVIQDYRNSVLDLGHPSTYRRFNRPIAVQFDERAAVVSKHYDDAKQFAQSLLSEFTGSTERLIVDRRRISPRFAGLIYPPYHYPSHCSNEAIVLNFLVRLLPYTYRHLRFQDNNYDVPDRLFHSVATTWNLATTTTTCVKELLPEFYYLPEMFVNETGLSLGCRQPGYSVDSVELPPWAKGNPRFFTLICRAALESTYTTSQLSRWIDLTFGYKQTGRRAKEALNLYHPYTYFGTIDVDQIEDKIRAQAVEAMINNYGQTPKQLFKRHEHPTRFDLQVMHGGQMVVLSSMDGEACWSEIVEHCDRLMVADHPEHDASVDGSMWKRSASAEASQLSTRAFDITPLETVTGLRWGTWAGNPQSAPLRIIWKIDANSHVIHNRVAISPCTKFSVGHLCPAIWNEMCPSTTKMQNNFQSLAEIGYTLQTLKEAWGGFVQYMDHFNDQFPQTVQGSPEPLSTAGERQLWRIHWKWSILGCERLARVWLSSKMTENGNRLYVVKLFSPSTNPCVLQLQARDLNTSELCYDAVTLTLPVVNSKMKITALTVSQVARGRMQLYVGTSNGLIYVRRCPMELSELSDSGWFPKEFVEGFTKKTMDKVAHLHPNETDCSITQQTLPKHNSQTCCEAGLWEVTGWRQLVGHAGKKVTTLAVCQQYGLLASGDDKGGLCLWDTHRLTFICRLNTYVNSGSVAQEPCMRDVSLSAQKDVERLIDIHQNLSQDARSRGVTSNAENVYSNHCNYHQIDGLCFSPTSGELAVSYWSDNGFRTCWIGVYNASGTQVMTRILDFMAEITEEISHSDLAFPYDASSRPPIPMAYSTVTEGQGVNCLLLGGPGGRIVWLNCWTLDTVRTMLLPQTEGMSRSQITAVSFVPATNPVHENGSQQMGELLCQGVCISDHQGWIYYLAPLVTKPTPCPTRNLTSDDSKQTSSEGVFRSELWFC